MKDNMIIYVSKYGNIKVDVNIQNENIWMSQDVMANLYFMILLNKILVII